MTYLSDTGILKNIPIVISSWAKPASPELPVLIEYSGPAFRNGGKGENCVGGLADIFKCVVWVCAEKGNWSIVVSLPGQYFDHSLISVTSCLGIRFVWDNVLCINSPGTGRLEFSVLLAGAGKSTLTSALSTKFGTKIGIALPPHICLLPLESIAGYRHYKHGSQNLEVSLTSHICGLLRF